MCLLDATDLAWQPKAILHIEKDFVRYREKAHAREIARVKVDPKFDSRNLEFHTFKLYMKLSFPNFCEMKQIDLPLDQSMIDAFLKVLSPAK